MSHIDPHELISGYLDGTLREEQAVSLNQWVKADRKHARQFVESSYLHRRLLDRISAEETTQRMEIQEIVDRSQGDDDGDLGRLISGVARLQEDASGTYDSSHLLEAVEEDIRARAKRLQEKLEQEQSEERERSARLASWQRMSMMKQQNSGSQTRHYVIPRPLFYGSIAAVIAIAVAIIWPLFESQTSVTENPDSGAVNVVAAGPVADLLEVFQARWADDASPESGTQQLLPGSYHLIEGLAKIRFRNGVEVMLEAPVKFKLVSEEEVSLELGKVVGHCPPGTAGFVINTPNARIVDLGTEFGVSLDGNGVVETHVFDGEVTLTPMANGHPTADAIPVVEGAARRVDATGSNVMDVAASQWRFVREHEFQANLKADTSPYHRWLAYSMKLRRDRDVVAYYDFSNEAADPDHLLNLADATGEVLNGTLGEVGDDASRPGWTQGRWQQKGALRFAKGVNDRVVIPDHSSLRIDGPMTVAAWVKRAEPYNGGVILSRRSATSTYMQFALLGSKHVSDLAHHEEVRAIQWGFGKQMDYSQSVVPDAGRWQHVAATFDGSIINFYLDGKPIGARGARGERTEFVQGDWFIGVAPFSGQTTWDAPFNGLMDELIIFRRKLEQSEIETMVKRGDPKSWR